MVQSFAITPQSLYSPDGQQLAGVNDLFIGDDGNLVLAGITEDNSDQLQAVLYACQNAAQTLLGECIFNTPRGLPNFQLIWTGVPNIPLWEAALINILSTTPGVSSVESVVFQRATDTNSYGKSNDILIYTATIITLFGTGTIDGGL